MPDTQIPIVQRDHLADRNGARPPVFVSFHELTTRNGGLPERVSVRPAVAKKEETSDTYDIVMDVDGFLQLESIFRMCPEDAKLYMESESFAPIRSDRKMRVLSLDTSTTTGQVLRTLAQQKLHPANAGELIALCKKFPALLRGDMPIVALGQKWVDAEGGLHVLTVRRYRQRRFIELCPMNSTWDPKVQFAAVYL